MAKMNKSEKQCIQQLKQIIRAARSKAYSAINFAQVEANWLIGQRIVEQEQKGEARAEYGKHIIELVSTELIAEFGKGYSETNIRSFRKFYLTFTDFQIQQAVPAESYLPIKQALPAELTHKKHRALPDKSNRSPESLALLSWTHYERLLRVQNPEARRWYMKEAAEQMWDYRTLGRNIDTQYYERLLISQKKAPVVKEMKVKTKPLREDKLSFIKNPTVLEFLGLPGNTGYTEAKLESAIITHLQQFLLELGKGFAFVERQQLIRTESADYYIDLVFYNYILKCFVLIDLKTTRITHQDVGQMDMYVRMFDEMKRTGEDNPTIGIVLCAETDEDIARYSILKGNEQLFATKYKLYLPSEEELRTEIDRQKEILSLQFDDKG
jgi:predicted nuclease of restriction endonuclease-like (RecB) superfamily